MMNYDRESLLRQAADDDAAIKHAMEQEAYDAYEARIVALEQRVAILEAAADRRREKMGWLSGKDNPTLDDVISALWFAS